MKTLAVACAVLLAVAPVAHAAAACHATSGATVRPLVELYTSEGCDSCPPADRWLSAHFRGSADGAIALAFHVDYWDRLGWKDRFATPAYTARQYQAAGANGASFVYTPQVLLQGHDFRWQRRDAEDAVRQATAAAPRARIEATVVADGPEWRVEANAMVDDPAARGDAVLTVAYADSGLVSEVKAGENRGARLSHDRVVRALYSTARADREGRIVAHARLPRPAEAGRDAVVVAFVQREGDGSVLQALELPLAACASR